MSRIGRLPIQVPNGVTVSISGSEVSVKGPKGELKRLFDPDMAISNSDNMLVVARPSDERNHRALHGLTRTLLANMVEGVSKGYERNLDVVGVGYRVEKQGEKLMLRIGMSHLAEVSPMAGVSLVVEGANRIKISGINKEIVGEMAARIRALRPVDAYKGKGIKYSDEVVKLKPGKTGKAVGGKK